MRICDLAPGDYQITAMEWGTGQAPPPTFGYSRVTIANEDYRKLRVVAQPRFPISGEVVWDGVAPPDPLQEKLSFSLRRITGAPYMGEDKLTSAESSMPGEFLLPGVLMEEYSIQTRGLPRNVYIKEMTYGNQSVLHAPLRVGASAGGSGLRVVLARDGGTVNVKVNDKDGNPVGDCGVVLMPANAASEAALAAAMLTGKTTQRGTWSPASVVAPGKYYVLATSDTVDKSPETISRLWRVRSRGEEIDLSPSGSASVTLTPKGLE